MRQELNCTECGVHVRFNMDFELDGNHVIECPKCGHEHFRVVKDGKITEDRYDPNCMMHYATGVSWTDDSSATTSGSTDAWLAQSWYSATSTTGN